MNRLAALGALLVFVGPLRAAAPPTPEGPTEAVRLVRQLGASSFAARERAAARLLQLGRAASPSLRNGLKSRDLEVRRRCAMLLPAVLRTNEDRRLDAFLRDGSTRGNLPGWVVLKKLAGDDLAARLLYAELDRSDRPLLALLDKGSPPTPADVAAREGLTGLLVAACCAPSLDEATYSMLTNILARPPAWERVRDDPALRRLASRAFATHGTTPTRLSTTAHLAKSWEHEGSLDKTVRPAVLRYALAALTQPLNLDKVNEAVNLACLVGLQTAIGPRARPVVRQLAEDLIARPPVPPKNCHRRRWGPEGFAIRQVLGLLRALDMQDTIDGVLKPALLKRALAVAERPDDQNTVQRVHRLATAFEAKEVLKVLKVPGRKLVLTLSSQPKEFPKLYQAIQLTQQFDLPEAREAVVRPAVRKHVLFVLESYEGLGQIDQVVGLAEGAGMSGLIRDTLGPVVRSRAANLAKAPLDVDEINHAHQLALRLGLRDVTNDAVKPALRQLVVVALRRPLNSEKLTMVFSLVRALRIKEGAALASQSAAEDLEGHARARAALLVATFGSREQIARLEALLGESASLGSMGFGNISCSTQLSDAALGALVLGSGQSLIDFGFPYFKAFRAAVPLEAEPVHFGFPDAEARANAIAKWKKWSAAQKKK